MYFLFSKFIHPGGSAYHKNNNYYYERYFSAKIKKFVEKKKYAKAQIETITDEAETISEKAPHKSGHTGNYITVISGTQTYRLEQSVQKTVHMALGGLMEIYSSKPENH